MKPMSMVTAGAAAPAAMAGAAAPSGNDSGQPTSMTNKPPAMTTPPVDTKPTLYFLNNLGQVIRANDDGSMRSVIVASAGSGPDGVAVDVKGGHVFWTNMGLPSGNDGTIARSDLDGKNVETIVKSGGTYTPKQMKVDVATGKLYWSDREGMRVMRSNLDGSMLETLVQTGTDADRSDASHWCVGIAVDVAGGKFYWTQKGPDNGKVGTINRAPLDLAGQDPAKRTDIEVLFKNLPEPIDLDLDLDKKMIYWTDRGDNTVSRAPMDPPAGFDPAARKDREILVKGLSEAIGITLDLGRNRMFYTDLAGNVAVSTLDGGMSKTLLKGQGALTGIALAELPK
jgi:DNA-binding beta-propeller fold protein YncE